jgi:large subunit ribosomal protein L23
MISAHECLISPVMTEKTMNASSDGVHVFRVDGRCSKLDVKDAVEKIFKVKVASVNTLNRRGKIRVFRGKKGRRNDSKFAVVRLAEGKINFEGGI